MVYRAIGLMSGSSLDGLDIIFCEIIENGGKWSYDILCATCYTYPDLWVKKLKEATSLSALDYQLLHTEYGHYLGEQVNRFIKEKELEFKVGLVSSHGHTTFHVPDKRMTAQLGDGAAIAAVTQLPVVSDLRSMDIALNGQGAPIVPIGEKLLLNEYDYFLNIGGIVNISANTDQYVAFDVCPGNRVLNMLAAEAGKEFDDGGRIAATGKVNSELLEKLNKHDYYKKLYPKSLSNSFGTDIIYPLIKKEFISISDSLCTYTEHISVQIKNAIAFLNKPETHNRYKKFLITGGGAFNQYLVERIKYQLNELDMEVVIPDEKLVKYKEALIMALIGVLRWREEINVFSSVTGAAHDSIGGALWMGQPE